MGDGDIDYSKYTLFELEEALAGIDKLQYPQNYANSCSFYERLKTAPTEAAQPAPAVATSNIFEKDLPGRFAFGIAFIPIAILLVWLNVPWWGVALTIGIGVFAFNMATNSNVISGNIVVASFGITIVLAIASYVVAENMHTSFAALVENYSVNKYVRRLPEYALSALSFSVVAGISWVAQQVLSRNSAPGSGGA